MQTLATAEPAAPPVTRPDAPPAPVRRVLTWLGVQSVWLIPALLTALVVGYRAASPQPWRDEFATWTAARRPVSEIVALGQTIDGVTVPYYIVAHAFTVLFGDSILALRLPSMIAAVATAVACSLLALRLWGTKAGMLTGLLVAVMPAISRYGQEARGYALAACFAAVATLLLVRALESGRWWRWAGYGMSVAALGLSHQIAILLLSGHLVAVAVMNRRRLPVWVLSVLPGVAALVPWSLLGLDQRDDQLVWLTPVDGVTLAAFPGSIFINPIIAGAVIGLAAATLGRYDRWSVLLVLSVPLPVALLYAVDHLIAPIFIGRYLYFTVPLLLVLAGRALSLARHPAGLAVVVLLAAIGLPAQQSVRRAHSNFDYARAAELIRAGAQPGDAIVYAPRDGWQFTDVAMEYHLGDDRPNDILQTASPEQNRSLWSVECESAAQCLTADRVWTLSADNLETGRAAGPVDQLSFGVQAVLTSSYDRIQQIRIDGFTLCLFVREPTPVPLLPGQKRPKPVPEEPTSAWKHYGPGAAQSATVR